MYVLYLLFKDVPAAQNVRHRINMLVKNKQERIWNDTAVFRFQALSVPLPTRHNKILRRLGGTDIMTDMSHPEHIRQHCNRGTVCGNALCFVNRIKNLFTPSTQF
jgi:hypothetical protein